MVAKFYFNFVRACKFGESSVILLFHGFIMYNFGFFFLLDFSYSSNSLYQLIFPILVILCINAVYKES